MSWSRFQRDARKPMKPAPAKGPLTVPQALIVTAGMAGLVGLCAGAILRFAFANSPDTRFLSPLQTFPALSDWDSELSEETADARNDSADGYAEKAPNADSNSARSEGFQPESTILTSESAEPIDNNKSSPINESLDTQINKDSKATETSNFDAFAARENGRQRTAAPLDLLKQGPDLSGTRSGTRSSTKRNSVGSPAFDRTPPDSFIQEETYNEAPPGDVYDDSERYADELYQEDPYYGDDNYGRDNYGGDDYGDNYYPSTDESVSGNDAYYDQDQW